MCIRDSDGGMERRQRMEGLDVQWRQRSGRIGGPAIRGIGACLLYTSDAADERSSVDLGGRRIIKKKTKDKIEGTSQ